MSRTWTAGEPPTDLAAMLEAVGALMGEEFAEALDGAIYEARLDAWHHVAPPYPVGT